jgi:hypothetical protein
MRMIFLIRQAGDLLPQIVGVVVVVVDRDHQPILVEPKSLRDQFPGELDRLRLEIIAEREIAEHLEERVMARGIADIVEIVVLAAGAHAFLRGTAASRRAFLNRALVNALLTPVKTFLNCTMPRTLVNIREGVGSLRGTFPQRASSDQRHAAYHWPLRNPHTGPCTQVSRWWGGLPRARAGKDGLARRPKKQLTSICDLLADADRAQATEWVRQALRQERFRYYEGDQTYPKHIWHQDESGRYWFGFCINGIAGTYKGWPIDEAEKRATFN